MDTPETGNRNDNRTLSLDCKSLASTCIPPWLRFQVIPRMVREPTIQITSVCNGTRVYLRRFSNIPPLTVRNKILSFCLSTGFWRKKVAPIANDSFMVCLSCLPVPIIIGVDLFHGDLRMRRGKWRTVRGGNSQGTKNTSEL